MAARIQKSKSRRKYHRPSAKPVTSFPLAAERELLDGAMKKAADEIALMEDQRILSDLQKIAETHGTPTYMENVDHPAHYGGKNNPYEAIKVIEAWDLGFHLGNTVKYISRAGKKTSELELKDLQKAKWYLDRYLEFLKKQSEETCKL
jgi:hypothetical protein